MLRITVETGDSGPARFRLEGRLSGPYVEELGRVLVPAVEGPRTVTLDLSGVTFVDGPGAQLLRSLVARNVGIQGCSGFVAHLLGLP
ncbi:MAG TPA: STAS domain-containing protein [Vicinamibacteria bacterium]|nr:STAS domain-containing protein [Vicinamibacteria bacterium]